MNILVHSLMGTCEVVTSEKSIKMESQVKNEDIYQVTITYKVLGTWY